MVKYWIARNAMWSVFDFMNGKKIAVVVLLLFASCVNRQEDTLQNFLLGNANMKTGILVIGDSLTAYSEAFGLAHLLGPSFTVNYAAVPGYDFTDWTYRIDQAFIGPPPNLVLVPLGTNDGYRFTGQIFLNKLYDFHSEFRKRSNAVVVYFQMPRTKDPGLSAAILQNNAALVSGRPGDSSLLDLDTPFQNAANSALLYQGLDPIHPVQAGYDLAGSVIAAAIFKNSF